LCTGSVPIGGVIIAIATTENNPAPYSLLAIARFAADSLKQQADMRFAKLISWDV